MVFSLDDAVYFLDIMVQTLGHYLQYSQHTIMYQTGATSGFEMCFAIGSQHLTCWLGVPTETRLGSRFCIH